MVAAGSTPVEGSGKVVDVVDLATDTTAWKVELDDASAWAASPLFTADGEHVVAGVFWDPYNRDRPLRSRGGTIENPPPDLVGIRMWDADTGELVEQYDVGRCGGYPARPRPPTCWCERFTVRPMWSPRATGRRARSAPSSSIAAAASGGCSPRTPGACCGVRR